MPGKSQGPTRWRVSQCKQNLNLFSWELNLRQTEGLSLLGNGVVHLLSDAHFIWKCFILWPRSPSFIKNSFKVTKYAQEILSCFNGT